VILRSARRSGKQPFDPPARIASMSGFVEAPTLSADTRVLYFHRLEGGCFVIERVVRQPVRGQRNGLRSRRSAPLPDAGRVEFRQHGVRFASPMLQTVSGPRLARTMEISVRVDDLSSLEVQELIGEHLAGMRGNSPPGQVHALALEALRAPNVTFWCAWIDGALCGCGALKELDHRTGEVKSMRTRAAFARRGVAQVVLDEIIAASRRRGYSRLLLETGTGPAFEPAHALYRRNGFEWCRPFGDYVATDFNVFMSKSLV
jgi:putative acetyltransferase